jgi:ferredoxin
MKIKVHKHICQGHSMCVLACPELFAVDEDSGHAMVRLALVPPEFEPAAIKAQLSCPEEAIEIFSDQ